MSSEKDIQGIFRKVFDPINGTLKVDVGGATITVAASDLRIGGVEIQDKDTGDRVAVTPANELTSLDPQVLALLSLIKNVDGIKKIADALPTGANVLGRVQLTDGTLDIPVVNNGSDNAVPIVTDARQEQVEILAPILVTGGLFSAVFNTATEGFYSNRLFIESSAATTISIVYSTNAIEFPDSAFDSISIGAGGFELATTDMPGWAKFAKVSPLDNSILTVDIFRSR